MKQSVLLICLCLLASCAGHKSDSAADAGTAEVTMLGDTILINPQSPLAQKIETSVLEVQPCDITLSTSGVVEAMPQCYAEVSVPFAGRIQRSLVRMGQEVKAGTPLFEIYSKDYSEVVKNLLQAKSALENARKMLSRMRDLHDNHVASDKELEEAEALFAIQNEEYRHAMAVAKEYQVDARTAEVGQPMIVRSPIAGRVLRNDLVMGQYLKEDADAMVVVADLRTIWIKANVTEKDAPLMDGVGEVSVSLVSRPGEKMVGKLLFTGGLLDPETRSLQTIVECKNPQGHMLPNMYANLEMNVRKADCLRLPKEAVLQAEDCRCVLRKVGENRYVRTLVQVQSVDDQHVAVTDGLTPGDEVVTTGAFYLIDCK